MSRFFHLVTIVAALALSAGCETRRTNRVIYDPLGGMKLMTGEQYREVQPDDAHNNDFFKIPGG